MRVYDKEMKMVKGILKTKIQVSRPDTFVCQMSRTDPVIAVTTQTRPNPSGCVPEGPSRWSKKSIIFRKKT